MHNPEQSLSLPTSPSGPHRPGKPHCPGPQQPAPPSLPHSVLETAPARTPGEDGGSAAQHWPVQDRHVPHSGQDCMSYVCFRGPGHIPSLLLRDGEWGLWLHGVGWGKRAELLRACWRPGRATAGPGAAPSPGPRAALHVVSRGGPLSLAGKSCGKAGPSVAQCRPAGAGTRLLHQPGVEGAGAGRQRPKARPGGRGGGGLKREARVRPGLRPREQRIRAGRGGGW